MEDKVLNLIKKENKKRPLTDSEIANKVNISRERVNDIRKYYNIPNSRERLRPHLIKDAEKILLKNNGISHRMLKNKLNELGYRISRQIALNLIHDIKKKGELSKIESISDEEIIDDKEKKEFSSEDSYRHIIGFDRSLNMQIRQSQAAILYPPKGMHTLILGESGVGKSQLAEAMYKFAVRTANFDKNAPFVTFNCSDYADNPQLLLSQLFGYVKGAFTGADREKDGIIELANEGILFLDEIHRLPSEGQEILFTILDKGRYKKLGETRSYREANLMIIGATSENPNSSLLITFRRRIPMVIELPALKKRHPYERYKLIRTFFSEESKKIKKEILVEKDVISMLMAYECPGNIGQLRSDIQVACARGLLNAMIEKSSKLHIKASDLANHVKIGILNKNLRNKDIVKYASKDLYFNNDSLPAFDDQDSRYVMPDWIYKFIEDRTEKLEKEGINPNRINSIIGREIEQRFENMAENIEFKKNITKVELKNLVGAKISNIIDSCQNVAKNYFPELEESFYYTLAIHLSTTYERLLKGKAIKNPHLLKIKKEYGQEYKVAGILAEIINAELEIKIPEDEIGFIAMYLKTFSGKSLKDKSRVGVVVLTHGKVGKAIVEVANKLLNTSHGLGVEMSLTESPQVALEKTIEVIKRADEGKGCVLLVDMGSLVVFGDIITKQTGIPVRVIKRVDTLMTLEVLRRAMVSDSNLDDIVEGLSKPEVEKYERINESTEARNLPKAIVTICITGEGSAQKIKDFVENLISKQGKKITVIPIGLISPVNIDMEIDRISRKYDIMTFVGTINPEYKEIPFISIENIVNEGGINRINAIILDCEIEKSHIKEILDDRLIFYDIDYSDKNDAIDSIVNELKELNYVDEDFLLSVYKREAITPTYIKGNVAIPHGFPQHVTKPVIAIAKLKNDIIWSDRGKVDIIFLIAYRNDSKKYFKNFYKIILNEKVIKEIRSSKNRDDIKDIIIRHYKK